MVRLFVFVSAIISTWAQTELSDSPGIETTFLAPTLASDCHAIWVNPANLGFMPRLITYKLGSPMEYGVYRQERRWSVSLMESGAIIASDAVTLKELSTIVLRFGDEKFSLSQKQRAAENFGGRSFALNINVLFAGIAYRSPVWGGVAVGVRDRISGEIHMNSMLARILFLGRLDSYFDSTAINWCGDTVGYARQPKYYSELFDSSRVSLTWLREFAAGYGRSLILTPSVQLLGGVTFRLIEGYMLLDGKIARKSMTAYSAISPLFNIDYGKAITPSLRPGAGMIPVGSGYGVDLGLTLEAKQQWRIALSILDIGSVRWDGNVFAAEDTVLNGLITTGFSSYDIVAEAQNITGEGGYFKWRGLRSVTVALPMRMRLGVSHSIGIERDVGVELTVPLRTDVPGAWTIVLAAGVRYTIVPWLVVSGGVRIGTLSKWTMPLGLELSLWGGRLETGIATQDLASYVVSKHPTLSLAMALLRVHL